MQFTYSLKVNIYIRKQIHGSDDIREKEECFIELQTLEVET